MSGVGIAALTSAMVEALSSDEALTAFTTTDRPAKPAQLPHIRVGPVSQEPWSTSSSSGAQATLTLGLTSRQGSRKALMDACQSISMFIDGAPLELADASVVLQRTVSTRLEHDAAQDLERALMKLEFLLDFGPTG